MINPYLKETEKIINDHNVIELYNKKWKRFILNSKII